MKLLVTNARNQRGWSSTDHLLDDSRLHEMIGQAYASVASMRRAALARAESFPLVEYELNGRRYQYDGSPTDIPGRHVQVITEINA